MQLFTILTLATASLACAIPNAIETRDLNSCITAATNKQVACISACPSNDGDCTQACVNTSTAEIQACIAANPSK